MQFVCFHSGGWGSIIGIRRKKERTVEAEWM